ncbi:MAG: DUF1294 domain-containing protein [Candidatus Electrothrix sp. AR4]|nr:DUF1294 domain-containing protein [Candidatus Electrothrix sp. AR4]
MLLESTDQDKFQQKKDTSFTTSWLSRTPLLIITREIIIYELVRENNNRYKAANIKFAREVKSSNKQSKSKTGSAFTTFFCIGLLVSGFSGKLPVIVVGLYIVMSLIAFIAYAIDKSAAQNGRWRTQESTLHIFSLIGGWPGAFFAQTKLRHKSSKEEFKRVYWVTVFLNLGGFFWLHTEKGTNFLNNVVAPLLNG